VRGNVSGHYVSTEDEGDAIGKKTLEGTLTGGVVGLVFGPAGLAAGLAIGGIAGRIAEGHSAPHEPRAFLDDGRADVPPKHSAILLRGATAPVAKMGAALGGGPRRGELTRHPLSDELVASLQEAVASSPPVAPG